MRALIVAAVAALGLTAAACDNGAAGAKQALVTQCVSEGNAQAVCTCMADKFAAVLPPDQLAIMAKGNGATDAEKSAVMQNPQFMQASMQAISCVAADPSMMGGGKSPF